jgi:hypothetical protein
VHPISRSYRSYSLGKTKGPPGSAPGRPFVADARTTVVALWVWWTSCTFRAAPHVASGERGAAPHVARGDQRAVRLAVVHPVSYRALLERLVLHRLALERLVLERLVMAVPEPQHLTLLARWSAGPRLRLVREVKTRLDATSVFHSCWRPPKWAPLPRRSYQRPLKMNAR